MRKLIALSMLLSLSAALCAERKKKKNKNDELPNQTLELPKELPSAAAGETAKLIFSATPLSNKGLLSQQVRDALKALLKQAGGSPVVHLRAFVAGSGDLRRVPAIVSETFTAKRLPLPSLTVVQVGAFPLVGAQVLLESVLTSKKPVNKNGIAFIAGRGESSPNPLDPIAPLAEKTLSQLHTALGSSDPLRVTCFASSLDPKVVLQVRSEFPKTPVTVVQIVRAPLAATFECEAVARLNRAPATPVEAAGGVVRINAPRLIFSSSQMAFQGQDSDIRLAFQRLDKALASTQASSGSVVYARFYPLTRTVADQVHKIQTEFFKATSTTLLFEGLPSLDASFGMDVIAIPNAAAAPAASPRP